MINLNDKIIYLFRKIYDSKEEDEIELIENIKWNTDEEKKTILIALNDRYESMIFNYRKLISDFKTVQSLFDEKKEEDDYEEINFNF